jgi:putative ABC transport system permease protein
MRSPSPFARALRAAGPWPGWISVGLRTGMIEIRSHPLRSTLSALGILFGVAVMVAMLSLMGGMNRFLNDKLGEWMGTVFLWSKAPEPEQRAEFSRSRGLRLSDGLFLEENSPAVKQFYRTLSAESPATSPAGNLDHVHLRGVDSGALAKEFTADVEMVVREGQCFAQEDYAKGNRVCLIPQLMARDIRMKLRKNGRDTADLFTSSIDLKGARLRIIGVFGPKTGEMKRGWRARNVYVPFETVQKYVLGYNPNPGSLWMKVRDPKRMDLELEEITSALISRHRGVEDFEYSKPDNLKEFIGMMENVSRIMGIVALIALLSGGLGIMNVMLSSISERVREIGVRKALGASPLQIFVQFIAETSTLCFIGGIMGALLGCLPLLAQEAIGKATDGVILPQLSLPSVAGVFLIISVMGVLFGLYPALKASRMNPIEALRYE